MSFTEVAAAIQEVSNALEGGQSPAVAEAKAAAALSDGAAVHNPDEDVSVSIG
jgi:hypothetical protein